MNKKSKVLALTICFVMLICAMPMMGFAATIDPTTGIGTIEGVVGASTVTFTVPYTMSATTEDQVTILVTKSSSAVTYGTDTQPNNIVYIDQVGYTATSSFSFVVDKPTATDTYYIKVGGTGITAPAASQKEILISSGLVVDGTNIGTVAIVKDSTDVYGATDAKLVSIDISSLLTGTDVANNYKVTVKGTELRFNSKNNKFVGTPLLGATAITPSDIVITKEARTVPDIVFGNLDNDASGVVNTADITYIIMKSTNETLTIPNGNLSADVNLDGYINTADITYIINKSVNETSVFPADQ